MDIQCNSCGTEYEFDDEQIPAEGVRVKCEVCQNIFLVAPTQEEPEPEDEEEQVFMIRQVSGKLLEFTDLETLHEWILEGIVSTEDAISSTGDSWAKLGQLPELEEIFAQVPQDKPPVLEPQTPSTVDDPLETAELIKHPTENPIDDEPDNDPGMDLDKLVADDDSFEPDFGKDLLPADMDKLYDDTFDPVDSTGRSRWPLVLGIFVLILGASLGGLFYLELIPNPFVKGSKGGGIDKPDNSVKDAPHIKNAVVLMAGGTRGAFQRALKSLSKCPSARCFSYKALLRSLSGYTHYIEMKIMEQKLERLDDKVTVPSTWAAQRVALLKGIKDETQEAVALANTAIEMQKEKLPEATIALILADIVSSRPIKKSASDSLAKNYSANIFGRFADAIFKILAHKHDLALSSLTALDAMDKAGTLRIPVQQLRAWILLSKRQDKEAKKTLAQICTKRPELKLYCSLSTMKIATDTTPTNPVEPPKGAMKMSSTMGSKMGTPKEESGDYDSFYMKAQQAYKLGNKAKAKRYYLKAAQKDPTSADPLNGVGWCHMDGGNYSGAITYFKKALALVPQFSRARYGLAEAYYRAGNKKAALREYKNYVSRHTAGRHAPRARMQVSALEKELGGGTEPDMTTPAPMKEDPPMKADPSMTPDPMKKTPDPMPPAMDTPAMGSDDMKKDPEEKKPVVIIKKPKEEPMKPAPAPMKEEPKPPKKSKEAPKKEDAGKK